MSLCHLGGKIFFDKNTINCVKSKRVSVAESGEGDGEGEGEGEVNKWLIGSNLKAVDFKALISLVLRKKRSNMSVGT
jgi:hypothetical protein